MKKFNYKNRNKYAIHLLIMATTDSVKNTFMGEVSDSKINVKEQGKPDKMKSEEAGKKEKKEKKTKKEKVDIDIDIQNVDRSNVKNRLKEYLKFSNVKHKDLIMKLDTLKEAHLYCVYYKLSSQQYGPLLEMFLQKKFNFIKNKAEECIGDCSKDGKNSEIKVSLGGETFAKFNFVQIRPSHECDNYILTAYHICDENVEEEGELYIFKVPKSDIKNLVMSYGGYAHGTMKEHGPITMESLNDEKNTKEYALRTKVNDKCWDALMAFRVSENDI